MFKFLKDKLKKAISKFSKGIDEQADDVEVEEKIEKKEVQEKPESPKDKPKPEPVVEERVSEPEPLVEPQKEPEPISVKEEPEPVPEPKDEEPDPEPEPKEEEPAPEQVKEDTIPEPELVEERKVPETEPEEEQPEPEPEPTPEPQPEHEPTVEEERPEEPSEAPPEIEEPKKKGFFAKIKDKITHHDETIEEEKPEPEPAKEEIAQEPVKEEHSPEPVEEETPEPQPEPVKEQEKTSDPEQPKPIVEEGPNAQKSEISGTKGKKGLFGFITEKITKKSLSEEKFDKLFFELEMALLENNVAVEVIDKIKDDLKGQIVGRPLPRGKIEEIIIGSLIESIRSLFSEEEFDLLKKGETKKPYVICFLGINGSGKTTSIAKVAHMLLQANKSVVLAASDTFRAAAIDQLQLHADRLGIKLIKHDYGADAAAVAFDAVKHGEAKGVDFVLIDTAGRMHSNVNLQDELKKIIRVSKPDLKIFVGEAITGNDCVEQAVQFNKTVGIDAIILTKADVDEKGGAFVSVSYVTKKPIAFIGIGQGYGDLKPFSKQIVMENLGLA